MAIIGQSGAALVGSVAENRFKSHSVIVSMWWRRTGATSTQDYVALSDYSAGNPGIRYRGGGSDLIQFQVNTDGGNLAPACPLNEWQHLFGYVHYPSEYYGVVDDGDWAGRAETTTGITESQVGTIDQFVLGARYFNGSVDLEASSHPFAEVAVWINRWGSGGMANALYHGANPREFPEGLLFYSPFRTAKEYRGDTVVNNLGRFTEIGNGLLTDLTEGHPPVREYAEPQYPAFVAAAAPAPAAAAIAGRHRRHLIGARY